LVQRTLLGLEHSWRSWWLLALLACFAQLREKTPAEKKAAQQALLEKIRERKVSSFFRSLVRSFARSFVRSFHRGLFVAIGSFCRLTPALHPMPPCLFVHLHTAPASQTHKTHAHTCAHARTHTHAHIQHTPWNRTHANPPRQPDLCPPRRSSSRSTHSTTRL
jgi:hypothetical protein